MNKLYGDDIVLVENFLSAEEEVEVLSHIKPLDNYKKGKKRNSIRRYGKPYYRNGVISEIIPDHLLVVAKKMMEEKFVPSMAEHVTINEYYPGENLISAHIDNEESGELITVVSLLADTTMIFKRKGEDDREILLPGRSLLQLKGEMRWKWTHETTPVTSTRYSLVFRL